MKDFKQKVFELVRKIPKGKVSTYRELAMKLGNPFLARAVGNVLSTNRDKNVPCHRVVRSDGNVGGFAHGSNKKISLLKKEGVKIGSDGKIC